MLYRRRIMGIETEYGITSPAAAPDHIARTLFAPVLAQYQSTNVFTSNSSRLYLDVGDHPELATPECDSLHQLMVYDRAGDQLFDSLVRQAEDKLKAPVYLLRNNIDTAGNTFGCHENYLVSRDLAVKTLGQQLVPFLVTRQIICGSGYLHNGQWLYSQRADHIDESVSSATTRARPMVNTRDEPHADSSRFRRLHVIVGDSCVAEPSLALKVGSMLLVLEMLEAGVNLPDLTLASPSDAIRAAARDEAFELADGRSITAYEVQNIYYEHARSYVEDRVQDTQQDRGGVTSPRNTPHDAVSLSLDIVQRVLHLWGEVLTAHRTHDFSAVQTHIDWVIKRKLIESYRQKHKLSWNDPRLVQLDLLYHDIRESRGVGRLLEHQGLMTRWTTPEEVTTALHAAPATTRAADRGRFLAAARRHNAAVTVDWSRLKVNRPEPQVHDMLDPFLSHDSEVDRLISYIKENCEEHTDADAWL